ncbi:MAG: META domain-containing protein [Tannerella sp.]|jgi:heat shock protein HslJ|nr:META domain-containing protein [Tannerella sp.]
MRKKMFLFSLIAIMTGLVACRTQKAAEVNVISSATALHAGEWAEQEARTQLAGKYWKLVDLSGELVATEPGRATEAHLIFHADENRAYGNGGCNTFRGTYSVMPGDSIHFSPMISTMKMCLEGMETENKLMQAFRQADHYRLDGDTLTLNEGGVSLARFKNELKTEE